MALPSISILSRDLLFIQANFPIVNRADRKSPLLGTPSRGRIGERRLMGWNCLTAVEKASGERAFDIAERGNTSEHVMIRILAPHGAAKGGISPALEHFLSPLEALHPEHKRILIPMAVIP